MGATSLTEKWDAGVGSFGSQNHFMLGQINEWFFHDLAGIQPDSQSPGFKHFIIHPDIVGGLTEVKASYDSVHGQIVSEWKLTKNRVKLNVVIPANTTATIALPTTNPNSVTESGKRVDGSREIAFVNFQNSRASYQVGSGDYTFEAEFSTK
jgi:hypothetical protein